MSAHPYADGRDEERFRGAFVDYYGPIVAFGVRRLGDRAAADDLAAEVLVVAWRRFAEAPENLLPWLYGIAGGVLRNQRRAQRRRMRLLARLREILGCTPGAAKVRLHRARRRLAQRLATTDSTVARLPFVCGEPSEETP